MNNPHTPRYKRGTITKDGKLYGCYPDGSLYRIYSTSDRPFLQIMDVEDETSLRIRHATQPGTPAVRIEVQSAGSGKAQSHIYNSPHTHIPFTKKGAAPGCAL